MPSPAANTPRRTSRRTSPKRSPLQERTASQKNGGAGRLQRDSKPEMRDSEIFTTTPFPTKPQHVLLPSTIRKQRSRQNVENELPSFFNHSHPDLPGAGTSQERRYEERRVRRAPNLQLKRSVSALRDMYEAQAESSRPSTAALSPALRPTSSRMRSISSSEGFSGRSAWEMLGLPKVSADDLSTLPPLSELPQTLDSEHSFASRVRHQVGTSSPNFRTFSSSNPDLPTFQGIAASSDPLEVSSSSGMQATAFSSPNVVQLFHSSSVLATDPTPPSLEEEEEAETESSPNVLKLGTTSPQRSASPTPSHASTSSRKRKRSEMEGRSTYAGQTPLFFTGQGRHMQSSPPIQNPLSSSESSLPSESRFLPSSPPEVGSTGSQTFPASSPVVRVLGRSSSVDRSSLVSAHASLQNALSSSPAPPIQRPIVRAPNINQFETLAMQKRATSGPSRLDDAAPQRLSPVPSISNIEVQQLSSTNSDDFLPQQTSTLSGFAEELDENLDDESMAPVQAYMMHHDLNSSQVRIMSDADQHEAADELSALPRTHSSFAAALSHAKSASFLGSSSSSNSPSRLDSWRTSMEERMQSMRSFAHGRTDSMRSSYRPASSGSYMSASLVPTWARGYYSGFYRDSFHYLYRSSSNLGYAVTQVQPPSRHASLRSSAPSSPFEAISAGSGSNLRRSLSHSVRSSIKNIVPSIALPSARSRLDVRQSHTTAGIGPLVSNPVRPVSEMISRPPSAYHNRNAVRRVSMPLSAADPRFHWNGIVEELESVEEARRLNDHAYTGAPRYGESASLQALPQPPNDRLEPPLRFMRLPTPHLHHDRQLHTGSSASKGYGAPYNTRPKWQPSGGYTDELGRPSWFRVDLRDLQVVCFMAGFLFPLAWFLASVMPLPVRPSSYHDLEKMEAARQGQPHPDWDNVDVLARLRLEKHLRGLEEVKWQNARWWRRMNRWMSFVGLVILVVVIVLAVIGTRSHWA